MSVEQSIQTKLQALQPALVEIGNESHLHGGPATESHFKVTVVTTQFNDMPRVRRHQAVYQLLAEELAGGVHALALHLYTPAEWEAEGGQVPDSPACAGGSRSDAGAH